MSPQEPHVSVHLQVAEYPSERDVTTRVNLDESLIYDAIQPLDFPSPDAGIAAMLCSDTVTIRRVTRSREEAAKIISKALTKALLDAMSARDTQMGYTKTEGW